VSQTFHGGCACGAVRYEASAEPVVMLNCHCRHCQQASGSAYAATVVFPLASVKFTGELRYHRRDGEKGAVERGFCPTCGSPVALKLARLPQLVALHAASLDDPSLYQPAMDIFTASAQPWDYMHPDLPKRPHGTQS
jgi:hypothetical protein